MGEILLTETIEDLERHSIGPSKVVKILPSVVDYSHGRLRKKHVDQGFDKHDKGHVFQSD